jgi:predicted  nucleic acid-binding Zn-ribbon protein
VSIALRRLFKMNDELEKKIKEISISNMKARYEFQELLEKIKNQDTKISNELEDMRVYFESIDSSIEILLDINKKVKGV